MKKKLIGVITAVILLGVLVFQVVPAFAQAGVLDHIVITPASASVAAGNTQQFAAQAYDGEDAPIQGLTYYWTVVAGGGSINASGQFLAGTTAGTYSNTIQAIAVQGNTVKFALASVMVTAVAGPLDHVVITPATATIAAGGTQQFTAQAYDSANVAISGLSYSWGVLAGGGTINASGQFLAGSTPGTYTNTVQVITLQGAIVKSALASVTVTAATPTPQTSTGLSIEKLVSLVNNFLRNLGFDNSLSAQWVVKDSTSTLTVKAIPGVINTVSDTSLTIMANGETTTRTFTLTGAAIRPENTQLKVNDKVVVVTVNDQVRLVFSTTAPVTVGARLPLGLEKNGHEREGKSTPPGWSKGNKTGWEKASGDDEEQGEQED